MYNGKSLTLSEYIENFRKVIEMSWHHVASIEPYPRDNPHDVGEAVGDWLQMQWEYLVEGMLRWTGQLDGFLECYGVGADSGFSSRYADVEAGATHRICIRPRHGSSLHELIEGKLITFPEEGLPFHEFVSFPNGWHAPFPPFDHVIVWDVPKELDTGLDLVFRLEDVQLSLVRITEPEDHHPALLTRRELFILVEDEIRRFQDPDARSMIRTLLIEPVDKLRYGSDKAAFRVSMVVRLEGDVTIGYRHTVDEAKWAVFHPDPSSPYTLGPEARWHVHLEDAFYDSRRFWSRIGIF